MSKWDSFYMGLAEKVSEASKDPSTKVGAYIADEFNRPVSHGFNGFPRGVRDDMSIYANRDEKLRRVLHAEQNAMLFAGKMLNGCSLYVTHYPCARCAAMIIQVGIIKVVCHEPNEEFAVRWADDIASSRAMFGEAGVEVIFLPKSLPYG